MWWLFVTSQAIEITYGICFLNIYLTTLWWDTAVRQQHLAATVESGVVFQGARFGVSLMDHDSGKWSILEFCQGRSYDHVACNTQMAPVTFLKLQFSLFNFEWQSSQNFG